MAVESRLGRWFHPAAAALGEKGVWCKVQGRDGNVVGSACTADVSCNEVGSRYGGVGNETSDWSRSQDGLGRDSRCPPNRGVRAAISRLKRPELDLILTISIAYASSEYPPLTTSSIGDSESRLYGPI